mmetsp:Transcript_10203/g.62216  ORF Transcript_10203/g.62216 Transcript_10203/m.62216 type:complete len:299 (-) Transcript_10203:2208-3104(-)
MRRQQLLGLHVASMRRLLSDVVDNAHAIVETFAARREHLTKVQLVSFVEVSHEASEVVHVRFARQAAVARRAFDPCIVRFVVARLDARIRRRHGRTTSNESQVFVVKLGRRCTCCSSRIATGQEEVDVDGEHTAGSDAAAGQMLISKKKKTKNESREKRGKVETGHHGTQKCSNTHANGIDGRSLGFFHGLLVLCFRRNVCFRLHRLLLFGIFHGFFLCFRLFHLGRCGLWLVEDRNAKAIKHVSLLVDVVREQAWVVALGELRLLLHLVVQPFEGLLRFVGHLLEVRFFDVVELLVA